MMKMKKGDRITHTRDPIFGDPQIAVRGRIVGFEDLEDAPIGLYKKDGIVLVELDEPVSFLRSPESIWPDAIKPEYVLNETTVLGYGVVHALEEKGETLPPGRWSDDEREYLLDQPMPISKIRTFCKKHYPDTPHCFLHASILGVIPLRVDEGTFSKA